MGVIVEPGNAPALASDEPSTLDRASVVKDNATKSQLIPSQGVRQPPAGHAAVRHSPNLR